MPHRWLLAALLAVCACRPASPPDRLADGTWIDLTHPFDSATIYWPTARPFRLEVVSAQRTQAGYYYAANNISAAEHGGTHLDAPIHFSEGKHATDEIPLSRLMGRAVVIDVAAPAGRDADYRITPGDIETWEAANGRIPAGSIVLLRTGWAARWPDRARYLGTAKSGPAAAAELHFPGLHPDAADVLIARRIDAVGIDTPSIDYGQSTTFDSHQRLFGANIPAFENVAHLDRLPAAGAFVIALPMLIKGGSGGPLRIVALVP
jgi:kynurenine formamidase